MNIDYYSAFFIDKPELEITFKEFSDQFNIPVERKLKAIKDKDEFLAEIIEFQFGIFFGSMFNNVQHERKIFLDSLFTPDWTIINDSHEIVAEVIRLNSSQRDLEEEQVSDKLMETLENIPGDYVVQLKYKYEKIKDINLDHAHLNTSVTEWLKKSREISDFMVFNKTIQVTVTHKGIGSPIVHIVGAYRSINFDYRRLSGQKSRLFSKLKYADAVNQQQLPYFICIHLSFESGFDTQDMFKSLYGCSGIFHGDEPFEEFYPDAPFHSFMDGLFYNNEIIKNCVSGIIVYYQGTFTFFQNYCNTNRLPSNSKEILNKYLYEELKCTNV